MNPWQEKQNIDLATDMAARNGFRLVQGRSNSAPDLICLRTAGRCRGRLLLRQGSALQNVNLPLP